MPLGGGGDQCESSDDEVSEASRVFNFVAGCTNVPRDGSSFRAHRCDWTLACAGAYRHEIEPALQESTITTLATLYCADDDGGGPSFRSRIRGLHIPQRSTEVRAHAGSHAHPHAHPHLQSMTHQHTDSHTNTHTTHTHGGKASGRRSRARERNVSLSCKACI